MLYLLLVDSHLERIVLVGRTAGLNKKPYALSGIKQTIGPKAGMGYIGAFISVRRRGSVLRTVLERMAGSNGGNGEKVIGIQVVVTYHAM